MIKIPSFGRSTKPAPELPARLESLATAVALAEGRLDAADVDQASSIVDKAGERLRHGTTHTLVALLGATGSGKSSMANAIAQSDIATTGVRRPTTSSTLALVWGDHDAGPLLHWLDVDNRHVVDAEPASPLAGMVLLDVPDHDSVAVAHRLEMERIAEHADLLIWVTDPEKYADEAMHHYLRLLSRHGAVTLMLLNKTDRLTPEDLAACVADLRRLLTEDGIVDPTVLPVSATAGNGIDAVHRHLAEAVEEQRAMIDRLAADVGLAADGLATHVPPGPAPTIDEHDVRRLAVDLAGASGVDVVADASAASYRHDAALRTGWPATRWVRRLRPDPLRRLHLDRGDKGRSSLPAPSGAQTARASASIRQLAEQASTGLAEPWPTLLRDAATPQQKVLHDRLDLAVSDAVRDRDVAAPRWWSAVGLLQVVLALAALAGGIWLTALAANNWLQLPEFGTPTWQGIPLPTGLLILGLLAGWLLALLSRKLAAIGGRRRASSVRVEAAHAVEAVAEELVVAPLRAELTALDQLQHALVGAGAMRGDRPNG